MRFGLRSDAAADSGLGRKNTHEKSAKQSMLRAILLFLSYNSAQALRMQSPRLSNRRSALAAGIAAALPLAASAEEKPKFQRLSPIQFIAALGDPQASSGTGAEQWGLWREDPGPRGVYLRDFDKRQLGAGKPAPAGWTVRLVMNTIAALFLLLLPRCRPIERRIAFIHSLAHSSIRMAGG